MDPVTAALAGWAVSVGAEWLAERTLDQVIGLLKRDLRWMQRLVEAIAETASFRLTRREERALLRLLSEASTWEQLVAGFRSEQSHRLAVHFKLRLEGHRRLVQEAVQLADLARTYFLPCLDPSMATTISAWRMQTGLDAIADANLQLERLLQAMLIRLGEADLDRLSLQPRRSYARGLPDSLRSGHFIGRTAETEKLSSDEHARLWLHGPSGFGKTRLAAEYFHRERDRYEVSLWLTLDQGERDGGGAERQLIDFFRAFLAETPQDDKAPTSDESIISLATLRLASRRVLFIVDGLVASNLPSWTTNVVRSKIVVTSVRAPSLGSWSAIPIQRLSEDESLRILDNYVTRHREMSEDDARSLVRRLEGHPLALTLAASIVEITSSTYGEMFSLMQEEALRTLRVGKVTDYQSDVADLTRMVLQRLTASSREVMDHLALLWGPAIPKVFVGFTLYHVSGRLPEPTDLIVTIAELSDWSLIETSEQFIHLHSLIAAIVREANPRAILTLCTVSDILVRTYPAENGPIASVLVHLALPHLAQVVEHLVRVIDNSKQSGTAGIPVQYVVLKLGHTQYWLGLALRHVGALESSLSAFEASVAAYGTDPAFTRLSAISQFEVGQGLWACKRYPEAYEVLSNLASCVNDGELDPSALPGGFDAVMRQVAARAGREWSPQAPATRVEDSAEVGSQEDVLARQSAVCHLAAGGSEEELCEGIRILEPAATRIPAKAFGARTLADAQLLNNLGSFYSRVGRFEDAEAVLGQALSIKLALLPPSHPELATTLTNLANSVWCIMAARESDERVPEALQMALSAVAMKARAYGVSSPELASSLLVAGRCYVSLNMRADAQAVLDLLSTLDQRSDVLAKRDALSAELSRLAATS